MYQNQKKHLRNPIQTQHTHTLSPPFFYNMGCTQSTDACFPDPSGASQFTLKKKSVFGDDYRVMTAGGEDWLKIDNHGCGSTGAKDGALTLQNLEKQALATAKFDINIKAKTKQDVDSDSDSDDSVEETEYECKIKWTVKRTATISDRAGNAVATISSTMKGKSKAEVTVTEEENRANKRESESSTKFKLVEIDLEAGPNMSLTSKPEGMKEAKRGDRTWDCAMFHADYDNKLGKDVTTVQTKDGFDPAAALLTAFVVANFCHPCMTGQMMEGRARQKASSRSHH